MARLHKFSPEAVKELQNLNRRVLHSSKVTLVDYKRKDHMEQIPADQQRIDELDAKTELTSEEFNELMALEGMNSGEPTIISQLLSGKPGSILIVPSGPPVMTRGRSSAPRQAPAPSDQAKEQATGPQDQAQDRPRSPRRP